MTWKLDFLTNEFSSKAKKLQIISKPCILHHEYHIPFIKPLLLYIAISQQYWWFCLRIGQKWHKNSIFRRTMLCQMLKSSKLSQNHVFFTVKTILSSSNLSFHISPYHYSAYHFVRELVKKWHENLIFWRTMSC